MTIRKLILLTLPLTFAVSVCGAQKLIKTSAPALNPETGLVTLPGHVVPAVAHAQDLGRVVATLPFEHVFLQLKRSPEQEAALEQAIADLHDPKSPSFHQWMTAEQFGQRFGASDSQIAQVSQWLAGSGLKVEGTNEGRTLISFSGEAGVLENTFHTQIHNLSVGGVAHVSNISEPSVPSALAALVAGVQMADFKPHPLLHGARSMQRNPATKKLTQAGKASADFTVSYEGSELQLVAPGDFATIYNLTPVWNSGFRGAGQTVAVVEDSLMRAADVTTFRKAFGLSQYAGTFTQQVPAGALPCGNPGATASEVEAAADAEWAGATAPDAAVVLAGCADTRTEFGGLIATMNLLSQKTLPDTISMSYGYCEEEMGSIELHQFSTIFQQAVAEGVTVFVSSGDEGGASCDANQSYASYGLQTSGFTTTPYNVSVGGTDFYDTAAGTNGQYWGSTNSATFTSALSYIPEKTWNDSCADSVTLAVQGYTVPYGSNGLCNNYPGYEWVTTASGSGGPSAVYAKPTWQNVAGVPSDGVRDIPDVSLFAADGFWGHELAFCDSDPKSYGVPCNYNNATDAAYDVGGGTSFAAPALAGIFTIITQKYGRQGNAAPGFYTLAASEYGTQGSPIADAACNSTNGTGVGSTCTFNDVTLGSIDLPCVGPNCFGYSAGLYYSTYGALSIDNTIFTPAYPATSGWDFATGLGSVNAANLLANWIQVSPLVVKRGPVATPLVLPVAPARLPALPVLLK